MTVINLVSNCEQNRYRGRCFKIITRQSTNYSERVGHGDTCQRLLLFVERSLSMCESSFDLQFSLSDTSHHENEEVTVKDKASSERYLSPLTVVAYMCMMVEMQC